MEIPFSPPDITEKEIEAVGKVLESGWITTGPVTKAFEKSLQELCGSAGAICLNSATSALECALRLLGIGPGDEVIVSAYTYTASCSVICHVGATPVLVDVEQGSCQIEKEALENAISIRTKAVIPVDIGGVMEDYERISSILESKKYLHTPSNDLQKTLGRVAIIADAAHSLGASYRNARSGAVADFSAFSFHAVKNLTTAEGGALLWRNIQGLDSEEIYRQLSIMSLHGQTKDAFSKQQLGAWEYDILWPAYKCNMPDICAVLGLSQLERYSGMLERRKAILDIYQKGISSDRALLMPHAGEGFQSSMHLGMMNLVGKGESFRNALIQAMGEAGVATNVHYKPLPLLTAYKNLGFSIEDFPHAFEQFQNEITLPLNSCMTDDEAAYVVSVFNRSYEACEA